MSVFDSLLLGIIQGLTEFLPISSSGHLVILREWLNIDVAGTLGVDAVLQLASGVAVIIYFRKDLWNIGVSVCSAFSKKCEPATIGGRVQAIAIIVATIPIVIIGLYLETFLETTLRSTQVVIISLLAGSVLMVVAEQLWKRRVQLRDGFAPLSIWRGFVIGLFQVCALVPGFSRSGATISGGLMLGLSREQAGRFSFLLAIPIVCGAGIKKLLDGGVTIDLALIVGAVASFVVSLWCIRFLLSYIRSHSLMSFVVYRLALVTLLLFLI